MKLPKIELSNFDGDYTKWRQFRDLFIKMVHSKPLTLCQKLCYLQSCFKGEAPRLIQHFTATESNYEDAWQVVNKRYDNNRLLVDALLNLLFTQKPTQAESSAALKLLHDTTQECLLGLKNLGIMVENWDAMLVHLLAKLLDRTTRRLWERSLTDPREVPKMVDFMSFLEFQFESEEVIGTERKTLRNTSSTLVAISNNCIVCKQLHGLYQCTKFLSMPPTQRLQLVQVSRLCVNCLKTDHKASNKNCNICGKRHNTLLHLENHSNNTTPQDDTDNVVNTTPESGSTVSTTLAAVPDPKQSRIRFRTASTTSKFTYIC